MTNGGRRIATATGAMLADPDSLGNLAEDGGDRSGAVSWYGRYLREDAAGTYAAQALGRKMLIESRRASPSAGIDAEEYLHRFPSGSYADAARLILKQ